MHFTTTAALAVLASTTLAAPFAKRQNGTTKRGICYNQPSLTGLFPPGANWAYNWASTPDNGFAGTPLAPGLEYVPMLYNGDTSTWANDVETALATGNTQHLLGFNEPDQPTSVGGTDMPDATAAAQTYIQNVTPYKGRAAIGAPAVSAGGIAWLQSFADACAGQCQVDFVPLHFYDYGHPDPQTQFASLQGWLESTIPQVRTMFNAPNMEIWLTEFGFTPFQDQDNGNTYLNLALPYLDQSPDITRYSYFKADEGILTSNGQLSEDGHTYTGQ
ncbi:MAG: hypothetical protein MMC23_003820 [Stictis urceolatum]|nr:hypothetical protein [Stictis urceolata]